MESELILNAGPHAFGDGSHPTTMGVLAALDALDPALFTPRRAIDIGAGSGIISFRILEKFHCPVIATDIEKSAIQTLLQNAQTNGIRTTQTPNESPSGASARKPSPFRGEGWVRVPSTETPNPTTPILTTLQADGFTHPTIAANAPYDLIAMNILAEPLLKLAPDAVYHLAPEGILILSGILQWQEPQIHEAYASLNLELTGRLLIGDWATLIWQKPSPE